MYGIELEYWYNKLFTLCTAYYCEYPECGQGISADGYRLRYNMFGADYYHINTFEEAHPFANSIRLLLIIYHKNR